MHIMPSPGLVIFHAQFFKLNVTVLGLGVPGFTPLESRFESRFPSWIPIQIRIIFSPVINQDKNHFERHLFANEYKSCHRLKNLLLVLWNWVFRISATHFLLIFGAMLIDRSMNEMPLIIACQCHSSERYCALWLAEKYPAT